MVDCIQVDPQTSVFGALGHMLKRDLQLFLVVSEGRLQGIATTYDLVTKLPWEAREMMSVRVGDIMTRDVYYLQPEDNLKRVVDVFYYRNVISAPVVSEGKVLGVITPRELYATFADMLGSRYRVGDIMTYRYTTCTIHDSMEDLHEKMMLYGDKYLVALSGSEVVGMITPMDVLRHLYRCDEVGCAHHTHDILPPGLFKARTTDQCGTVAREMIKRNISAIPVVDEQLEGMLRFSCFLQFLNI